MPNQLSLWVIRGTQKGEEVVGVFIVASNIHGC